MNLANEQSSHRSTVPIRVQQFIHHKSKSEYTYIFFSYLNVPFVFSWNNPTSEMFVRL